MWQLYVWQSIERKQFKVGIEKVKVKLADNSHGIGFLLSKSLVQSAWVGGRNGQRIRINNRLMLLLSFIKLWYTQKFEEHSEKQQQKILTYFEALAAISPWKNAKYASAGKFP